MRMAAAGTVAFVIPGMRVRPDVMPVIGNGFDVVVGVRIEMWTGLPLIARPLDNVEKMWNHTRLDKTLPIRIEIDSPRIARAVREDLELSSLRMIPPDAGVDLCPLLFRR